MHLPTEQQSSIVGRSGRPFFADNCSTGTANRLFNQNGASLGTVWQINQDSPTSKSSKHPLNLKHAPQPATLRLYTKLVKFSDIHILDFQFYDLPHEATSRFFERGLI